MNVDVNTSVTVNFSMPMKCGSINKHTFRLKPVGYADIAASSVTCSGSTAVFTPTRGLAVSTRYRIRFVGNVKAGNGKTLKDGFTSNFTTSPNTRPPATATPTATAHSDRHPDGDFDLDRHRHRDGNCHRDSDRD